MLAGKVFAASMLTMAAAAVYIAAGSFPGTLKPSAEIAFSSGARATSIPGFIQHKLIFNSHHTSADFADFLASPSPLHECTQGNVDTTYIHKI
jgi:hypothetical protein